MFAGKDDLHLDVKLSRFEVIGLGRGLGNNPDLSGENP